MFRYDPLSRVPGRLRLLLGAALCLAPMGMVWKIGDGYYLPGSMDWGDCGYDDDSNYLCNPTEYTRGTFHMGSAELVAQSPVRVFLVFALVGLAVAAARGRTVSTLRLVRLASVSLGCATLLAAANGVNRTLICLVLALLLAAPLAWQSARAGVLASGRGPR